MTQQEQRQAYWQAYTALKKAINESAKVNMPLLTKRVYTEVEKAEAGTRLSDAVNAVLNTAHSYIVFIEQQLGVDEPPEASA